MNTYISEGVGKRIVDALKKQTEVEILNQQLQQEETIETLEPVQEPAVEGFSAFNTVVPEAPAFSAEINNTVNTPVQPVFNSQPNVQTPMFSQLNNNNLADFGGLEVPANVAVLRQLISQLPSGVSRQAGALVIKQTMEALGISMKSVLQEAQQLQENINMSARDCQNSILECKKQINTFEAQVQKYQKQSASLNDIISLFLQIN